jgi:hypothetical protein
MPINVDPLMEQKNVTIGYKDGESYYLRKLQRKQNVTTEEAEVDHREHRRLIYSVALCVSSVISVVKIRQAK